jgi:uncharacterized protein DUF4038/uncharacterized protein DUF5060
MTSCVAATQHQVAEWSLTSVKPYANPFADLELDVEITCGSGSWRVPAFWAGGDEWRVRFAPPEPGRYEWRSVCSDTTNDSLHGVRGAIEARAFEGEHLLLTRGPLRISENHRYLEFADGEPFFWLGDTWWMGLTERLRWPEDFQALAADRIAKGFNVIQIVAGLFPDMDWLDPRGRNEAGFPYDESFGRVNPAWFDLADLKIRYLVRENLMPCIVGCWGYYLLRTGMEAMKRHWRYVVARWGAYPIVWCLAGEAAMPYYLSPSREQDQRKQIEGWTEIAQYVRQIDPFHRPITIHPTSVGREQVLDPGVLDFDMLQTGHGGYESIGNTVRVVRQQVAAKPTMPVLVGEVDYEGFLHGNYDEVQRLAFWASILSGACGHTYGANGIWQVNTREQPYGPSPHGNAWGDRPWDEAARLPGSAQLGMAAKLLRGLPWSQLEPHPDWVEPTADENAPFGAYAAGVPGKVRIIYSYGLVWGLSLKVKALEPDLTYRATLVDPVSGEKYDWGAARADENGTWTVPQLPELRDWLIVLER